MYFDSHAHYDDNKFKTDREELLSSLPSLGVEYVVNSGSDIVSSAIGIELAEKYDYIYAAVGIHPHEAKYFSLEDINTLRDFSKHKKVVAIGECGLDYYYNHSEKDEQKKCFIAQLSLAKKLKLPIIIHSREAAKECFDMIEKSGVKRGVIHCYSGSLEMAMDYISLGFYIGVGGVVTYPNAKKLAEVAQKIPAERLLIETDCPYLAPVPKRGEKNNSSYLQYVVEKIAELRNISADEVANVTKNNAKNLFFK